MKITHLEHDRVKVIINVKEILFYNDGSIDIELKNGKKRLHRKLHLIEIQGD